MNLEMLTNIEFILLPLLTILSLLLLFKNFKYGVYVLIVLSVLVHKELFSIYQWDFLPVRFFMVAVLGYAGLSLLYWLYNSFKTQGKSKTFLDIKKFLLDPFVIALVGLWIIRGISIVFSKNITASVFLYSFFTTVTALGLLIYAKYKDDRDQLLHFIKFYFFVSFFAVLFTFVQLFVYLQYDIVIGAFWNVPGHLPRVGSVFWDVNHFGGMLSMLLPVLGVIVLVEEKIKTKIGYVLMFLPMTGVLLMTNSRTAWMAAFFAFLSFLTLLLIRKFGTKGLVIIAGAIILISIPFIVEYQDRSSPFRARVKQYFHYRIDSFDSHMYLLQGSGQIFEKFPVLGGGYGGFFEHFSQTEIAPTYFGRDPAGLNTRVPAHTIWGEALSETGFLGTFMFGALVLLFLVVPFYIAITSPYKKDYLLAAGMFSAIFGILMAGIFYSYNSEFFWLILFLYFTYSIAVLGKNFSVNQILGWIVNLKWLDYIVLAVVSIIFIIFSLGTNHLIPWDEAIYAQIAKNMHISGDYLSMQWLREGVWFEKPPLYFWLTSFWFKLLGVNEWAARMTSALAGIGTIFVVYILGRKLFSRAVGFISAFVLLTTFHFLYYSRAGMLDVTLTFFISLGILLYVTAIERKKLVFWIFSGAAFGLGVMTKGVVGFLPLLILLVYEITLFALKLNVHSIGTAIKNYLVVAASAVAVFLPWHLVMYFKFGQSFIDTYIGYHVLQRATTGIEDKGKPADWYLVVLRVSMRIWFGALLVAFPFSIISLAFSKFRSKMSSKSVRGLILILIWALVVFAFFSVARSKLIWYIIPIYPALSLIIGYFLAKFIDFVASKTSFAGFFTMKSLMMYGLVLLGLSYLFIERELVYTSDLTGSQANLLQKKDEKFGADQKVYADRIDLPLVLYYSEGPYAVVDFGPLRKTLLNAPYDTQIVFITKESRLETLIEEYGLINLELEKQEKEWVLAYLPAQKFLDERRLAEVNKELFNLQNTINAKIQNGQFITPNESETLIELQAEQLELTQKIENNGFE